MLIRFMDYEGYEYTVTTDSIENFNTALKRERFIPGLHVKRNEIHYINVDFICKYKESK